MKYTTAYLDEPLKSAAEEAIRRVNSKNENNGSLITFAPQSGSEAADLRFMENHAINSVGAWDDIVRDPSGALSAAHVYINPAKQLQGPNGPVAAFDPNQPNYFEALVGVFVHELGHTMGLDDVDVPDASNLMTCGDQTRGNSTMNAFCGVNNQGWDLQGGSQASDFTHCDQSTLVSYYMASGPPEEYWEPQNPTPGEQCFEIWVIRVIYQWTQAGWEEIGWYPLYYLGLYCEPILY